MHLHYTHNPQVDIQAFLAAKNLIHNAQSGAYDGASPDDVMDAIVGALDPAAINGYPVAIRSQLRLYVAPLLSAGNPAVRIEAMRCLIDYAAVQASSRDINRISSARAELGNRLAALNCSMPLAAAS